MCLRQFLVTCNRWLNSLRHNLRVLLRILRHDLLRTPLRVLLHDDSGGLRILHDDRDVRSHGDDHGGPRTVSETDGSRRHSSETHQTSCDGQRCGGCSSWCGGDCALSDPVKVESKVEQL